MIRISFINNKGGVGKTTSAFNIASYFQSKGYKVLMVDLDAQANLTVYSDLIPMELQQTIYDLMVKGSDFNYTLTVDDIKQVMKQSKTGIDIIPSNIGAERINQTLLHAINKEGILDLILDKVEDQYDLCVIDSPPNLGLATNNTIAASDYIFVPLKAGPWEALGMKMLSSMIRAIKRISKRKTEIGGIFFTQFVPMYKISKEMNQEFEEHNYNLMESKISNSVKLVKAAQENNSIFEYGKKNNTPYKNYEELAKEIKKIIGLKKGENK